MDVMVVEDDGRLRELYALAMRGAGHAVRTAADAATARRQLMLRPADALVLDLDLGTESGLGVATLADYVNPECRVIVVTGSRLFQQGELFGLLPSCAAVMRKPIDLTDLVALAEHHAAAPTKKAATPRWVAAAQTHGWA